jgi:cysteine desulfurase
MSKQLVYLDHSATTPTDPRVLEAMMPYFTEVYGNASSSHSFGRKAESAIEEARESIARMLNCMPSEIIFTSGGSEADNLAIRGVALHHVQDSQRNHLVTLPIEHHAIGKTIEQLAEVLGFTHHILPVDRNGIVSLAAFERVCRDHKPCIASIMYANNEVGTIEPIADLAEIAKRHGVVFHTDAVQAAGQLPVDIKTLGVDLMSLSAHKFYGPKGVGVLYCRDGINLIPSQSGGSHESGRRAGTSNTAAIVGMAKALELAYAEYDQHVAHMEAMRDLLIDGVLARIPSAQLTGDRQHRLASHTSFVFDGVESNILLMHLDTKGIAASGGSACKTGSPEPSGVLLSMGYSDREAKSSLRLTVGRQTTAEEIAYTVDVLAEVIAKIQKVLPA